MWLRPAAASQKGFVRHCIHDCSGYGSGVFDDNSIAALFDRIGAANFRLYVACVPAGMGRRELVGVVMIIPRGRTRELCWAVVPEHRQKGLGSRMVALAAQRGDIAQIERADEASAKIAQRAGFDLVSDGPVQLWRADRLPPHV